MYKKLKKDPTSRIENKITRSLRALEDKGCISDKEQKYLTPQCLTLPQMYGLPKIHKEGYPLRPIVSAIGSPTYPLAKELARILSPLADRTGTHVKNSAEFAQKIREVELMEGDVMISFDVVSLFTKVPIDGALQVISTLLAQDDSLEE